MSRQVYDNTTTEEPTGTVQCVGQCYEPWQSVRSVKTKQRSRILLQVDGSLLVLDYFTCNALQWRNSYERDSAFRRSVIQVIIITTVKHTVSKTECLPVCRLLSALLV